MTVTFAHPNATKIYGPPGAGKTRELVRILQEHVADGDFALGDGIIASFTKAAAHDIARRVNSDGEPGRYHCTLHALCKRYYSFDGEIADTKLKAFFEPLGIEWKRTRGGDAEEWASGEGDQQTAGGQLISFWTYCRNRMISVREGRALARSQMGADIQDWSPAKLDDLWARYQGWKSETGMFDFTDMLEYAVANPPAEHFAFFVLDEAQDCTPLQWAVAQAFAANADVAYLGGDEDQSIYGWLAASPSHFLRADTGKPDILHENHRSGGVLVEAAQRFIRRNTERQDKAMRATRPGGSIDRMLWLPNLNPNESTYVMARAHYLNDLAMKQLTEAEFPFVDKRGKYGVNGASALAYQRFLRLHRNQGVTLDEWRNLAQAIPSAGPWLTRGTKTRLLKMDPTFRRETVVRLRDLGAYGATEEMVAAVQKGETQPLGFLDQNRLRYLRGVEKRYGVEYLDETRAGRVCSVGPIHSFKGLEADHVVLHSGMSPAATREAWVDPEPERRVFYVAMTRAKERLTILEGRAFAQFGEVL